MYVSLSHIFDFVYRKPFTTRTKLRQNLTIYFLSYFFIIKVSPVGDKRYIGNNLSYHLIYICVPQYHGKEKIRLHTFDFL